ncbi:MAG TPA: YCF48-related protein, partial [Lacipirellulaceae bacterium]|nr:YCF48-related protein [Lacipirellulaceae bacterium]
MNCQDGRRLGLSAICFTLRYGIIFAAIYVQLYGFADAQVPGGAPPKLSAAESLARSVEASFRNDAALADVFFIDQANGWAVGDRGVIWHTADGGATWREQSSGVSCRLNCVFFLDARRGWAAGGEHRPLGRSTQGVLLQTTDGGTNWVAAQTATLPLLNRIKFFDPNVGVAVGAGFAAHPSGVFVTYDGGRDWQALPADKAGYWLAGDFLDAEAGAVAASAGEFATIARQRVQQSPLAMTSMRSTHAMRLLAPASGWLVGDGGLVMTTADLGHTWQSALAELPHDIAEDFDFHALAVHGGYVWIAGSPGSKVFCSADGGKGWQAFDTGQFVPIRALAFSDAQHGWAVGDLGTILATHDGGQTWQRQRAGGSRAALLALFPAARDV